MHRLTSVARSRRRSGWWELAGSTSQRLNHASEHARRSVSGTALTACSSSSSGKKVKLVAYSVPKPAYDALSAAFQKTRAGKGVKFAASYGASGDQSRRC